MNINKTFEALSAYFGDSIIRKGWNGDSWWQSTTHIELMVGAILVQNTNWLNVDKALRNFGDQLTADYILDLSESELAEVIRPAGFQNQKAKKLKALFVWFQNYDFDVEKVKALSLQRLRRELLEIKGVGKETADALIVYVFGKTSFVIDAYARRIFTRLGYDVPKKYDDFRLEIEAAVPRDVRTYDYYHGLLVEHAKDICTKVPRCDECPLQKSCKRVGI